MQRTEPKSNILFTIRIYRHYADNHFFKLGFLIQQARLGKGLTQEQLAEKVGTNKGYISKVENNIKDVRISTLQRIVEKEFGGHLELSIKI